jgi:pimeloyl-ACP methyl ester carboxylesterase
MKSTIVLLHGAFQDGHSTWHKVQPELEAHGHKVVVINLPGRGGDGVDPHTLTSDIYRDTVLKAIREEAAPVVLVGHSFGGITISNVAEAAPDKIQALVYLSAYLPQDGQSLMTLAMMDRDSYLAKPGNLVLTADYSVASIKDDQKAAIFGNDASGAEQEAIVASLIPEPGAPQGMPVKLTAENFGRVPKFYIETLRDNCVSPYLQEMMMSHVELRKVTQIDAGHASYITQPHAVAAAILDACHHSHVYSPTPSARTVLYRKLAVDGVEIAYREAGDPSSPKLVLLHGWPSSSHQYRNLIPALAGRFHVIAPDYPGFGESDTPDPKTFPYTFDQLAETIDKFLALKGFDRFGMYVQDYGGPVGFRVVTNKPHLLEWLMIQNTNAYEIGFSEAWAGLRYKLWLDRSAENEAAAAGLLELDVVKATYLTGTVNPELMSPDNWNMDYRHTLQRPHARQLQLDLFYDYRTNVTLYPKWQQFLRDTQPKTVIFWGQDDLFFTRAGGEAYLKDLPHAQMHRLSAGHFAAEDCLEYIAAHIHQFHEKHVVGHTAGKATGA